MKTSTLIGGVAAIVILAVANLLLQAWILGIILSWFNVTLTFGQNFLIILLANLITYNGGSSK